MSTVMENAHSQGVSLCTMIDVTIMSFALPFSLYDHTLSLSNHTVNIYFIKFNFTILLPVSY